MNLIEKKKTVLLGIVTDLWAACEAGEEFKFSEVKEKYSVSNEYLTYIKKHCVNRVVGSWKYTVKPGMNKELIVSKLANASLNEVSRVMKTKNPVAFVLPPVVKSRPFAALKKRPKSSAPGDTYISQLRLDDVKVDAKIEAKRAIEVDNDSNKEILSDVRVSVTVKREWKEGSDSKTFIAPIGMDYNTLVNSVSNLK